MTKSLIQNIISEDEDVEISKVNGAIKEYWKEE